MSYKIVQKKNRHAVYASGFRSIERAEGWIKNYDPRFWMDKTVTKEDLEIVLEAL